MDAINSHSHQIPAGLSATERSQRVQRMLEPDDVLPQIGSGQRFQMQSYFASIHGDIGWMRDPFQGCPYPGQAQQPGQSYGAGFGAPFFPGMPPMGCDPMAGGYWQGIQGMLSMQIAMMDRMIAMMMLMMQMNQGGGGQPCPCPPPQVDPCPPDVEPVPPDVDPCPPDVDPCPPDVDPVPPDVDVDPVPPEIDPAPVDPAAQRARQLEDFKSRLLQASPVSTSAVLEMARRSGLSDREGQALTTFLSLGRDATQFNFSQPKMRALLDIFMTSAKANGDVRAVAQALQHYSREVDDLLPEGCFDALLSVAGNPPGNEVAGGASLKQQLTEANGWGIGWTGRGCNMQNDRVVEILDSWATRPPLEDQAPPAPEPAPPVTPEPAPPVVTPEPAPPATPQERRSQAFQQLSASLSTLGNDVSPNTILQTFRDNGLPEAEGEQFLTFLSASLGQGRTDDFDFTRQETRDLVQVYAQAAGANGDLRVIARALLQYSEKCDNRLREEAFNALLFAGGNPPGQEVAGAEQLRTTLGEQDGWTRLIGWDGVDMRHSGVIQVLTANAERATPIGEDTAPPAPVDETPEARARRERNQNLDRFRDDLRTAGNSVNREEVVEIAQRSGLDNWEGDNLWQFLSNVGPSFFGGNYDFTNGEVLEYLDIYIDAAKSGNIQGAVAALRRYSSSERTNGRNLGESSFDALMAAAGNPPGTPPEGSAQLKRQLEEANGWGWGGVNTRDREVVQILENFQA